MNALETQTSYWLLKKWSRQSFLQESQEEKLEKVQNQFKSHLLHHKKQSHPEWGIRGQPTNNR